jgi:hypothetical protein
LQPHRKPLQIGSVEPYRLKLPKASRLKSGAYKLKVSFTPQGQAKAVTKTLKLKLGGGKRAGAASVSTFRVGR